MKLIKGFAQFVTENVNDHETLRDYLDPDNLEDADDSDSTVTAVRRVTELFSAKLSDSDDELGAMGFVEPDQEIELMRLADGSAAIDSIVEVFSLLNRTYADEAEYQSFSQRFPGILSYDEDLDEFRRPESSKVLAEEYIDSDYDEIRLTLFEDELGRRAVEWEDQHNLIYFMLKRDLSATA